MVDLKFNFKRYILYFFQQLIQDAIAYYLALSVEVPPREKLKLASYTGNELVVISTLYNQCSKVETLEDIVANDSVYKEVYSGPESSVVLRLMLEHQTKCHKSIQFSNDKILFHSFQGLNNKLIDIFILIYNILYFVAFFSCFINSSIYTPLFTI